MSQDLTKLSKADLLKAAIGMQKSLRESKAFANPFFEQLTKLRRENRIFQSRNDRQQNLLDVQREDLEKKFDQIAGLRYNLNERDLEIERLTDSLNSRDSVIADLQHDVQHETIGKKAALLLIANVISDREDLFLVRIEEEGSDQE